MMGRKIRRELRARSRPMAILLAALPAVTAGAACSLAYAEPKPLVVWTVPGAPTTVRAGRHFQLKLHGNIDPGWHLYALDEPDGGPTETEIALVEDTPANLLRVTQSPPRTLPDAAFQRPVAFFEREVDFTLRLLAERSRKAGPLPLRILVRYQTCNDSLCLPPHTDQVSVPVRFLR